MDKTRLAVMMIVSVVLVVAWVAIRERLARQYPEAFAPAAQQQQDGKGAEGGQTAEGPGAAASTQAAPASAPAPAVAAVGGIRAVGGEAVPAVIGHTAFDAKGVASFPMAVNIDPRGASIASVVLNRFRLEVDKDEPYAFQKPYEISGNKYSSMASRWIKVNGSDVNLEHVIWRQTEKAEDSATYAVEIDRDGVPLVRLEKRFQLKPKTDASGGYELTVSQVARNLTDQPVVVKGAWYGPTMPPTENWQEVQSVVTGYASQNEIFIEHLAAPSLSPDKGSKSQKHKDGYPIAWVGMVSAYFDAIVRPAFDDPAKAPVADVYAFPVQKAGKGGNSFVTLTWETPDLAIPAGASLSVPLDVYFGPRQRETLKGAYYAAYPRNYDETLVLSGGWCGICTWPWLINGLVYLLKGFYFIFRDWGLAIMGLVILVRLILHPITKRSQVQMAGLSKFGPEIERIKKKYADDQQEMNKQMMLFYKQHGATPILGCLPMFLQMPIWIALWASLQSTFELRHAPFLWGWTWIDDLSKPDRLVPVGTTIDVFFLPTFDALNLLPILMGVVFYLQMKLQPKPPTMTPEQEQQQKMMMWMMPFIMPLVLYNGPSGLNLYILTSTAIGIWESKRVREHIKKQEALEKAGPVIVDAEETPRGQKKRDEDQKGKVMKAKGGIGGWLANLQAQVEQIQKDAEKKPRKR